MTDEPRQRLGDTGQIHVTAAAAQSYADATGLQVEEARRELTDYLLDAVPVSGGSGDVEAWRFRRGSAGIDISARVTREGRLAVVIAVNVRGYRGGRRV